MCIGFPATSSFLDALGIITRGDHWDELFLNMTAPAIVLLRVQYEEGLSLSIPGGTIEPDEVGSYDALSKCFGRVWFEGENAFLPALNDGASPPGPF